jgi:hypothetical protein
MFKAGATEINNNNHKFLEGEADHSSPSNAEVKAAP